MRFAPTFLRSKIGRRILILFVACALLPIAALAIVSFIQVSQQLDQQSWRRLRQASKAQGMAIYERLLFLETGMKMIAFNLCTNSQMRHAPAAAFGGSLEERFRGLTVFTDTGEQVLLLGRSQDPPELTQTQKQHIRGDKTAVYTLSRPGSRSQVFMARALDPRDPARGVLVGEVNTSYLWDFGNLPPLTELCVLDHSNNALARTPKIPSSFSEEAARRVTEASAGRFEWSHEEGDYVASYWSLFLKSRFLAPKWTLVLSESRADALASMEVFRKNFKLVILPSLLAVLLVSLIQIRRTLHPLVALRAMTRRVARKEFGSRVTVTSGDEFEELAVSFNAMTERLGRQFNTLATMAEVGRTILSALDTERIVDTVLNRLPDIVSCDSVGVTLLGPSAADPARTYVGDDVRGKARIKCAWEGRLGSEELQRLRDNPERLVMGGDTEPPHFLAPMSERGIRSFLLLPLFPNQGLAGTLNLGYRDSRAHSQENLDHARQLADQVAVGLSNARLIEELERSALDLLRANEALEGAIAERKRAEQELVESQKMESIGRLVGGIAHDFNNKLSVVISLAQLALKEIEPGQARNDVEQIRVAGEQAASLTCQLLAFGRRQVLQPRVLKLNDLVANSIKMLERLIGEDIHLVFVRGSMLGRVKVDPIQIERVIMNLAVNARHAMPKGGTITIETANVHLDEEYARRHPDVEPGDHVMLMFSDTGCGMDQETRSHVFEPFFTTKEEGKGTGLGLSVTHGIVKQSGGHICVYSDVDQGTTFKIYLPAAEDVVEEARPKEVLPVVPCGSETILVVEDEKLVCDLVRRILEEKGYQVLVAPNGKRALEILQRHESEIQLLLTDVVMPEMGGEELVEWALHTRPDLKVIYMSGYTERAVVCHGVLDPGTAFMEKPVTPGALLRKVRKVLDAPRQGAGAPKSCENWSAR